MSTDKQLDIFDCSKPIRKVPSKGSVIKLFIDGASRKNPGPSGAGVYLVKEDKSCTKKGFYLGTKTNNQAEYYALLLGVFYAKKMLEEHDVLHIISDSELLVKQLKGEYKVKNESLKELYGCAFDLLGDINYVVCHVLREYNQEADALANQGIDVKSPIPQAFLILLKSHGIVL